jgi:hypothetical protein
VDDGSLERYLVGSSVPGVPAADQLRDSLVKVPKIRPLNQKGDDKEGGNFSFFLKGRYILNKPVSLKSL